MKKVIALLLTVVLLLGLVACSTAKDSETKTPAADAPETAPQAEETKADAEQKKYEGTNLKVWMAPKVDNDDVIFWDEQIDKFEEETGATVTVEIVGWADMATKYLTGFMSNDAADVLYFNSETLYDFVDQGCLLDLTPYWTEEEIAEENFWDASYINGKHYSVPFAGGSSYRGLIYNMDILNECGITELPTTWEELLEVCEIIHTQRPDIYTYLTPMTGDNNGFILNMMAYLYQAGGSILNDDGTAYTLNTPEALEAMNMLMTMVDKGYLSTDCLGLDVGATRDLFGEGKVAITLDTHAGTAPVSNFNWALSTEMGENPASFCPIDCMAVNANSANTDAAVELVKFLRSADVQNAVTEQLRPTGQLLKSWPTIDDYEEMKEARSHPERAYGMPVAPNLQVVIDSCMTNQQLMIMGTLTPEEALAQIQAEADKAFSG